MSKSKTLEEIFDGMPNRGDIKFFNNKSFIGIVVEWSGTGRGFGSYTFTVDKKTAEFGLDNECDSPKEVEAIMCKIVDENPETVKQMFRDMISCAKLY